MIHWIKKIFQRTEDKKEWLEHLFTVAETIWTEKKSVHFKIIARVKTGFLVKTAGLFAILPFRFMSWQYPNLKYWDAVSPTLEGKIFYCKIANITKTEDRKLHICIDATIHRFEEVSLENNVKYTGIILQKYELGMIVDIGYHFDWRCGSLTGYLPAKKIYGTKPYADYEAGDTADVVYTGCNEKGMLFAGAVFNDLYLKYTGRTVWAKVCKDENASCGFLIEGEHPAYLPISPHKDNFVKKMMEQWKDGDIINCKILDFNARKGFFIKWTGKKRQETGETGEADQSSNNPKEEQRKKQKKWGELTHSYLIKDVLDDETVQQLYESASE
ncbi:MAG: hypothetical protein LBC19_04660 [Tannerella sp.]|jgi:ribosomal protein S1|nr:hypothetical protein [Tannerella sp.]